MPVSVAIQAALEAGLALAASYALNLRLEATQVGVIASVFGIAHVMAWQSNKKFLARRGANDIIKTRPESLKM